MKKIILVLSLFVTWGPAFSTVDPPGPCVALAARSYDPFAIAASKGIDSHKIKLYSTKWIFAAGGHIYGSKAGEQTIHLEYDGSSVGSYVESVWS